MSTGCHRSTEKCHLVQFRKKRRPQLSLLNLIEIRKCIHLNLCNFVTPFPLLLIACLQR